MARTEGLIHRRLPPDAIVSTRQPVKPETKDAETVVPGYESLGLERLADTIDLIARGAENRSFRVDEYNSAAITGAGSSASVVVQPTYEYMPERIESIVITGPTGAVSLAIGDRIWPLTIPASGILVIAPLSLLLSRTDARILTPASAGVFTLELMGFADRRYKT